MLKNINVIQGSPFPFQHRNAQKRQRTNTGNGWQAPSAERAADWKKMNSVRRMLSEGRQAEDGQTERNVSCSEKVAESSFNYADSLRKARMKAKNTALKIKKLRYDYKSISTQILRSKTSTIAKQVVSRARREVIRLKRQRQNREYNDGELKAAILHAQAMLRVAKKKARHLQEEEMVKVTGGPCAAELEERKEQENRPAEEAIEDWEALHGSVASDDAVWPGVSAAFGGSGVSLQEDLAGAAQEQVRARQEVTEARMARQQDAMAERQYVLEEQQEMMSELMEETWDAMEQTMREAGLEELAEDLTQTVEVEMDPADFERMKIKHRSEEMKAIAEADAEYLKVLFDRLEKEKSAGSRTSFGFEGSASSSGSTPSGGPSSVPGGVGTGNAAPVRAAGAAPVMSAAAMPSAAEVAAGGFDVSV